MPSRQPQVKPEDGMGVALQPQGSPSWPAHAAWLSPPSAAATLIQFPPPSLGIVPSPVGPSSPIELSLPLSSPVLPLLEPELLPLEDPELLPLLDPELEPELEPELLPLDDPEPLPLLDVEPPPPDPLSLQPTPAALSANAPDATTQPKIHRNFMRSLQALRRRHSRSTGL
jgi:hypothetical protein